uniref:Uncharacterized protein n=1 Tax=Megaviridae environmental sample TaxID=1737588 RepID=A0A5J6VKF0_9VIRU|nr:MAG: hypothetical protein [Megaviridae environmental sample]
MSSNGLKISNSIPNSFKKQYVYNLELILHNNEIVHFNKIKSNTSTKLTTYEDKIKYSEVKEFIINIIVIDGNYHKYKLKDSFNIKNNFNSFRSNNIYIEFTNKNNNLDCSCHITEFPNKMLFTPPNY